MNHAWKIIGAAGAFVVVYVVRQRFGTPGSLVVVAALLMGWVLLHLYTKKRLDGLYRGFRQLDSGAKAQALGELDPEIREEIQRRIAHDKNA